ncbi:MAG: hypothetical protein HJJLKODD_01433 [Phycisphaerae bacterium]|nr:hypothetical protein [Phycisphaerae bacterium]
MKQRTIRKPVELQGQGLFTGEPALLRFRPAKPYSGVIFNLQTNGKVVRIPALVENITKRARRSSIRNGTAAIETVEHCLSAISGLGIDNIEIDLTGHEVPSMDGSSAPFVQALQDADVEEQDAPRELFLITDMVRVQDGDAELVALPPLPSDPDQLEIHYVLDYGPQTPIGYQSKIVKVTPDNFIREIAPARTFLLEQEAHYMRAQGIGTHLGYQDLVIFGNGGPIENQLRYPEECVRHKILDLIGDLRLIGRMIAGRVYARKSGHALNHELVRQLLAIEQKKKLNAQMTGKPLLDIRQIQRIVPHRYPFLLVDRVIELDGTQRAVGIKNVTYNEAFFQGHYPGQPIMPGVLILDALSQMGGILFSQELDLKGKQAVLISMDKVKFRRPVMPGDQLILEVEAIRVKSRTGHLRGTARVGDELAAEAEIKFMLADTDAIWG